ATRAQLGAGRLGAPVLPDDRVVDRRAGRAVPNDRRLALGRDADRRDVARPQLRVRERLPPGRELRLPELVWGVLDPAGLRVDLPELALRHRDDVALRIEHDAARARRALVECEQKVFPCRRHDAPSQVTQFTLASASSVGNGGGGGWSVNSASIW